MRIASSADGEQVVTFRSMKDQDGKEMEIRLAGAHLYVAHALVLTAITFGLHYVWENLQCPLFFVHREGDATQTAMLIATVGDVAMTWLAHGIIGIVTGRWLWILGPVGRREWLVLMLIALVMSTSIESYALATGRWSYTELNPLIPGTSVSMVPVAQLLVLFPVSFALTGWLLRNARDSRFLSALALHRKLEVHTDHVDLR